MLHFNTKTREIISFASLKKSWLCKCPNQNRISVAKKNRLIGYAFKAIKTYLNSQCKMIKNERKKSYDDSNNSIFLVLYGTFGSHLCEVKYELFVTVVLPLDRLALKVSVILLLKTLNIVGKFFRSTIKAGQVRGGWALEIESFLGPVKWHRADRRVPFDLGPRFPGPNPSHLPK
jgi:hypothetical protein